MYSNSHNQVCMLLNCFLCWLHPTLQHLDSSRTDARILDYSSVFNTICFRKLNEKLTILSVSPPTCKWSLDFLTERPPVLRMGRQVSAELTVSTESQHGSCSSSKLFTMYTHDCVSTQDNTIIIKYTDDTTSGREMRKTKMQCFLWGGTQPQL